MWLSMSYISHRPCNVHLPPRNTPWCRTVHVGERNEKLGLYVILRRLRTSRANTLIPTKTHAQDISLWKTSRVGTISTTYETNLNCSASKSVHVPPAFHCPRMSERSRGGGKVWGLWKTRGSPKRGQVGFLTACQRRNVSVSVELVPVGITPGMRHSVTAEGVGISWQRGGLVCVCLQIHTISCNINL